MKHFSRRATSADSGSECLRPGFLRLSPVRRLRRRLGESQGPSQSLCRILEDYPAEKMRSVWMCWSDSFHGIMEVAGWND